MLFWFYDSFEKEYHELKNPRCVCAPLAVDENGHRLLIHHKLATPDEAWTAAEIEEAREIFRVHTFSDL